MLYNLGRSSSDAARLLSRSVYVVCVTETWLHASRQVLPAYMAENKSVIQTGSEVLDQILFVLLSTSMFVAGFLGCLLDNTMPGE